MIGWRPLVLAFALSLFLSTVTCDDCTPTVTKAADADAINLSEPGSSSVLTATLTSGGKPLAEQEIRFSAGSDEENMKEIGTADTDSRGVAKLDLKRLPVKLLRTLLRADRWRAHFTGTDAYCQSQDEADFHLLKI